MPTWQQSAEDPRGTDELIRVALTELDLADEELPATAALIALQARPTREVLDRACDLCRSVDVDERRLGVVVLAELRDVPTAEPAFVEESMQVLLALAATEPNTDVLAEVARAFGFRRDPRAAEPLLAWRGHPQQPMRFHVACSLPHRRTRHNEPHVVDALIELTGATTVRSATMPCSDCVS
jgi:HEAT repeat protein